MSKFIETRGRWSCWVVAVAQKHRGSRARTTMGWIVRAIALDGVINRAITVEGIVTMGTAVRPSGENNTAVGASGCLRGGNIRLGVWWSWFENQEQQRRGEECKNDAREAPV